MRDPTNAVRLGLRVAHEVTVRHGFPLVHVGMHTGGAVERGGDWSGSTVNLAARVSSVAGGGEVLLTDAARAGLGQERGFELHVRGKHRLKNVAELVVLYVPQGAQREGSRSTRSAGWPSTVARLPVY